MSSIERLQPTLGIYACLSVDTSDEPSSMALPALAAAFSRRSYKTFPFCFLAPPNTLEAVGVTHRGTYYRKKYPLMVGNVLDRRNQPRTNSVVVAAASTVLVFRALSGRLPRASSAACALFAVAHKYATNLLRNSFPSRQIGDS